MRKRTVGSKREREGEKEREREEGRERATERKKGREKKEENIISTEREGEIAEIQNKKGEKDKRDR